jgi:hypothetical protein
MWIEVLAAGSREVGEETAKRIVGGAAVGWLKVAAFVVVVVVIWFLVKSRVGRP